MTQATRTGASPGKDARVRLYTRDGGLDHVEKLASAGGEGVWIPDTVASLLVLRPGQTINFSGSLARFDTKAKARVAGVYRDLVSQPRTLYWCAQEHVIYP